MLNRRALIVSAAALLAACDTREKDMSITAPKRGPTETLTSKDGTLIAYERWGAGPPVVLVDGAFCSRRFGPTDDLAPLLAKNFTVFAYDRRGRGESGNSASETASRELEDLSAILALAGGSANVFGMSSGGVLALEAAMQGLPIGKLAIYEPPYRVSPDAKPPGDYRAQLRQRLKGGDQAGAVKYYMNQIMQMPSLMLFIMQWTPNWSRLQSAAPSLLHEASLMGDFHLPRDRLAQVTSPTLVLAGGKGKDMMRRAAGAVAKAIPGAEYEVLEGQAHDVSIPVLAPALTRFFA